jgi:hypothetical protein
MTDDEEASMKDVCKRFATEIIYNRELEYYSVTFTEENWVLATLAEPEIGRYLK